MLYNWNESENYPQSYKDNAVYGEKPYLLPAGVFEENGEEVTYWIETVTGIMYKHIPSIDQLTQVIEVYPGTGWRADAIPKFNTLKPEIIGNHMIIHENGSIKRFNMITKLLETLLPDQEVISWN